MKICSICKLEKPFDCFYRRKETLDGYRADCKSCFSTRSKRRYATIKDDEVFKARSKEYYERNKSSIKARTKKWAQDNHRRLAAKKSEYYRKIKDVDPESILKSKRKYREANREKLRSKSKEYTAKNKSVLREKDKKYRQNYPEKGAFRAAKRRAKKLQATPKWLCSEELNHIADFYVAAKCFQLNTGQEYHVDHIVPLQGKTVCGLHVPWNLQILPAEENLSKSNKLEEIEHGIICNRTS